MALPASMAAFMFLTLSLIHISERTENEEHYRAQRHAEIQISVSDATAHAACLTAKDVNAAAIVTVSESGNTARLLSKYRPCLLYTSRCV